MDESDLHLSEDQDFINLRFVLESLAQAGVVIGKPERFTEHPNSAFEAVSLRARCSIGTVEFEVTLSGFSGEISLESQVSFFPDFESVTPGDERDRAVSGFVNWLKENAPVNLVIQRTYGRLTTEAPELEIPDYPERRSIGGTVLIKMPVLRDGEQFGFPLPTEGDVDPLTKALNEDINAYFDFATGRNQVGRTLTESLADFVDFLVQSQGNNLAPGIVRWSSE